MDPDEWRTWPWVAGVPADTCEILEHLAPDIA
jgi:hypothetical protein